MNLKWTIPSFLIPLTFANIITMLFMGRVYPFLRTEPIQQAISAARIGIGQLSMPISYAFPLIIAIVYMLPIIKKDNHIVVQRRILNAPLFLSCLAALGWTLNLVGFFIGIVINQIPPSPDFIINMIVTTLLAAMLVFIFTYFELEQINRRVFLPRLFTDSSPLKLNKIKALNGRFRFSVFFAGVGLFPILLLGTIILNLTQSNTSIILFMIIFLIFTGLMLTIIFTTSYSVPLIKMKNAINSIKNDNLNVYVPVESNDEIGILADGINEMAIGLQEKEQIYETFGRMVDPVIRDHLLSGEIKLGGENKHCVILFCDIRDYTSLSEKLSPESMVKLLNKYFEKMNTVIEKNEGIVNKYIGDAIMAIFNVPTAINNPEKKAVTAAIEMIRTLKDFNLENDLSISIGIGIHSGKVLAGNIGSTKRMEYTIIGDAVNVASRLEGFTKQLSASICISTDVYDYIEIDSQKTRFLGNVKVKGKGESLSLYEVFTKDYNTQKDFFDVAMSSFKQGNFVKAGNNLVKLLKKNKKDKTARFYLKQCLHLHKRQPEKWDGHLNLKSK